MEIGIFGYGRKARKYIIPRKLNVTTGGKPVYGWLWWNISF
ncbi:MAG: hypothetical protein ACTSPB_00055 [Candidatus Thorarchaeota archaeon]